MRPLGQNNLSQDRSYQGPYSCPDFGDAGAAAPALRSQVATTRYWERLIVMPKRADPQDCPDCRIDIARQSPGLFSAFWRRP
ncbi:hypothetical protein GCM10010121_090830 [Streptomyces brasiliensis]|uniref:Uncharacterized protein n=1 Tax=Streptomyces brasiliensis TaxID=1954 RepID=A0A917P7T3_9ACTN|nr:hypothetical protein GCM10010121_090830 [Streptomyces brasiliensis]